MWTFIPITGQVSGNWILRTGAGVGELDFLLGKSAHFATVKQPPDKKTLTFQENEKIKKLKIIAALKALDGAKRQLHEALALL